MAPTHHTDILTGLRAAVLVALLLCLATGTSHGMVLQHGVSKGLLNVRKGFRFVDVNVEGNQDLFLANNRQYDAISLGTGGTFAQTLRVDVDMEVLPNLSVRGRFDDTMSPAKQDLAVEYRGDAFSLVAGDVQAGFAGAEFPMESQTIFGARGRYTMGAHSVSAVAARMTGSSGHFEGKGDNTRGPYFLNDRKVVANSERVFVDSVRKFRGSDYQIDYLTGVVNFMQPVDDRFRITVDYEFEPIAGGRGTNLLVSRYAGDITTSSSLGMSVGTRRGSDGNGRDMFGFDGRMNLGGGTSLGGEVAMAREGEALGQAVRGELAGAIGPGTWNFGMRAVTPDYQGLSANTSRRDLADASVGVTYPWSKDLRFNTRLSATRDNLGDQPGRATIRDLIQENGVVWALPSHTRLELTLDNRNEMHQDDLEVHGLDSSANSVRVGGRYRLDKHLLRTSYELRSSLDAGGTGDPRRAITHVVNSQVQSQLFGKLFSTETFQYSRNVNQNTGAVESEEVLTGVDFASPIFKYAATNVNYTLQQRLGLSAADTHSAALSLRSQGLQNFSAETTLQIKRSQPEAGEPIGNAIVSGRLAYVIGSRVSLSADMQKPMYSTAQRGPSTLELRGSYRPAKEYDLGGGYRVDSQQDPQIETRSYSARVAYMDVTVSF